MDPIGDCNDDALIEALWSRMQIELLDTHRWTTRVALANAIFRYSEIFHNPTGATPLSACGHQSNTNSRHQHHTGGVNAVCAADRLCLGAASGKAAVRSVIAGVGLCSRDA
jgi:hypothetical protein